MIIRNKIRNRIISARPFTFKRAIGISRSEGKAGGGGAPSTGEGLAEIGSEVGTFGP